MQADPHGALVGAMVRRDAEVLSAWTSSAVQQWAGRVAAAEVEIDL